MGERYQAVVADEGAAEVQAVCVGQHRRIGEPSDAVVAEALRRQIEERRVRQVGQLRQRVEPPAVALQVDVRHRAHGETVPPHA